MSERVTFRFKVKREIRWLKEDLIELRDKVPQKYYEMLLYAAILMAYLFVFDDGLKHPVGTVIGSLAGAWIGAEGGTWIGNAIKKSFKKKNK